MKPDRLVVAALVIATAATIGGARTGRADPTPEVATLWRGTYQGDSLFVRALWVGRLGEAQCQEAGGAGISAEPTPEYLAWWLEARGSVQGGIHSIESIGCTDAVGVSANASTTGLFLKIDAQGWGCEPAGDCRHLDYAHLGPSWLVQTHGWTRVDWDLQSETAGEGEFEAGCLAFFLPVRARVSAETFLFEPVAPESARAGPILLAASGEERTYCPRDTSGSSARAIRVYRTPGGPEFDRVRVAPREHIELERAAVRLERGASGAWVPQLIRVEAQAARWRGFVTPADLDSIGFHYLR